MARAFSGLAVRGFNLSPGQLCPVRPPPEDLPDQRRLIHATRMQAMLVLGAADLADPSLRIDLILEGTIDGNAWIECARSEGWTGGIRGKDGRLTQPQLSWTAPDNRVLQQLRVRWHMSRAARVSVDVQFLPVDFLTTTHHSIGDRSAASAEASGASSLSFAHTVIGTTNLCLWVVVSTWRQSPAEVLPNTVTYAGQSLSSLSDHTDNGNNRISLWRRVAPAANSNTVQISMSGTHDITGMAISYSGVDQTTPNDTPQHLNTTSTSYSQTISSEEGDIVVSVASGWNWANASPASPLTERLENNNGQGANSLAFADAPGAASVACNWTFGAFFGDPHGAVSWNINQAVGTTPVSQTTVALLEALAQPSGIRGTILESLAPANQTATGLLEAQSSAVKAIVAAVESIRLLQENRTPQVESQLAVTESETSNIEALELLSQAITSLVETALLLQADAILRIEAEQQGVTSSEAELLVEALQISTSLAALNTEGQQGVAANIPSLLEALQELSAVNAAYIEASAIAQSPAITLLEALFGQLGSAATTQILKEALLGIGANAQLNIESELQGGIATVITIAIEAVQRLHLARISPMESLLATTTTTLSQLESMAGLEKFATLAIESLGFLALSRATSLEALQALSEVLVSHVEALASVDAATQARIEGRHGLVAAAQAYLEALRLLQENTALQVEVSSFSSPVTAPTQLVIEAIAAILHGAIMQLEANGKTSLQKKGFGIPDIKRQGFGIPDIKRQGAGKSSLGGGV